MSVGEIILLTMDLIWMCCGFLVIGLLFYIGKTRIKEIDKVVHGYEFPHDSIFALIIRVPGYAGGFMWKWSARRSGLEGKIEHFNNRFRWPFVATMVLSILAMVFLIIARLLQNYLGIE